MKSQGIDDYNCAISDYKFNYEFITLKYIERIQSWILQKSISNNQFIY